MDRAFSHENRPQKDTISETDLFLFAFMKAKKDLGIYPATNPVVGESMDKALAALKKSFGAGHRCEIFVEKDRLLIGGVPAGSNDPRATQLALALYRRGVRKVIVDPSITFDEMKLLLDAFNMKAEDIAEAGGMTALLENRNIVHASVDGMTELTILDGPNLPAVGGILPEIDGFEELESDMEDVESADHFSQMFMRVQEGDPANVKRLRKLLGNPQVFSGLLEKFAFRIEKAEGIIDAETKAKRMLEILKTVGSAISFLPSENERSEMMQNVAASVLALPGNLKTDLVNRGMMPNLVLGQMESNIISRFPVIDLADAILENFKVSGGTASIMAGYLSNLDLGKSEKASLVEALEFSLRQGGGLTPEVEKLLVSTKMKVEAGGGESEVLHGAEPPAFRKDFDLPQIEGYSPEKILFLSKEKDELLNSISNELNSATAEAMWPILLDLLIREMSPSTHTSVVRRISSYIDDFLAARNYDKAAYLIEGLKEERRRKADVFSPVQLKPLDETIEKHAGEQGIRCLLRTFKGMNRDSSEFNDIIGYFSALGLPAVNTLLQSLEDEQSRHVRLLTCQALAQIGEKGIGAAAEKIDHPQWFVARNAVSVLGQISAPQCIPHLQKALSYPEPRVRREALRGLASIRSEEAIDIICSCIHARDGEIARNALEWIAVIGSERALPTLERLLSGKAVWKMNEDLLRSAIEALGAIKTEPAIEIIEALAGARSLFRRRKTAFIRETATAVLNKVGGERN